MNKSKLLVVSLSLILSYLIISCKPQMSLKTTVLWVNKEKLPAEPVKSIFIIAFTDNLDVRASLEKDLAAAAQKRGLKAQPGSIGTVDINLLPD